MDNIIKGWFSEINEFWPGQALSIELDGPVLYHEKSDFQDILIFKSKAFGNVLVLDGAIQITEKDEIAYQEQIAHIPLFTHPNPKKVLVVGGGDGGVIREVAKHDCVEEIHLCEIDQKVIEASKKFLPKIAVGFNDPRVRVHIEDGAEFVKKYKNEFDVVITDSSDPSGPASQLFGEEYFKVVKEALTDNGVLITQAECIWLHVDLIVSMKKFISKIFPSVTYATSQIPTYPNGSLGFFLATKNGTVFPTEPVREVTAEFQAKLNYYTPKMHNAAFTLPAFAERILNF
ncbi:spermidine synthase-like [Schistocerca gregaria]|uniref:spermidine synthase-like n=1 Tax=Schistocerca gregaria TaxID=7010 RepID=UPI00211ED42C|nr:spermidine synthase-like [Schistocerca gregaria]